MSVYFRRRPAVSRLDPKTNRYIYRGARWELRRAVTAGYDKSLLSGKAGQEPSWERVAEVCTPEEAKQAQQKWGQLVEDERAEEQRRAARELPSTLRFKATQISKAPADELKEIAVDAWGALDAIAEALTAAGCPRPDEKKGRKRPASKEPTKSKAEPKGGGVPAKKSAAKPAKKKAATRKPAVELERPKRPKVRREAAFQNVVAMGTQTEAS